MALLCGMAASAIGVCMNCVGIFYTPVSDSLGVLRGSFALHTSISQLATSCIALAVPKLMGRFRYKRLLLCGVTVAVLSTAAMAFSRELWLFYLTGLLRGLGVGLFSMVPITIILTNWFHKSHGVATSITLSFSGLARGCMLPPVHPVCHGIGVGERLPCHGGGNSAFYPARPAGSIHRRPPPNGGCAPMATTASRRTTAAPQPRSAIKTPPFSACA